MSRAGQVSEGSSLSPSFSRAGWGDEQREAAAAPALARYECDATQTSTRSTAQRTLSPFPLAAAWGRPALAALAALAHPEITGIARPGAHSPTKREPFDVVLALAQLAQTGVHRRPDSSGLSLARCSGPAAVVWSADPSPPFSLLSPSLPFPPRTASQRQPSLLLVPGLCVRLGAGAGSSDFGGREVRGKGKE